MSDGDVLAVDQALTRLELVDSRLAVLVELRFFGGLSLEDASAALGSSVEHTTGEWGLARAWLRRALGEEHANPE